MRFPGVYLVVVKNVEKKIQGAVQFTAMRFNDGAQLANSISRTNELRMFFVAVPSGLPRSRFFKRGVPSTCNESLRPLGEKRQRLAKRGVRSRTVRSLCRLWNSISSFSCSGRRQKIKRCGKNQVNHDGEHAHEPRGASRRGDQRGSQRREQNHCNCAGPES